MKKLKKDFKRSPLHYNGNKFDIVDQILEIIDNFEEIVELFSGTGIVSLNSSANKVWLNDIDENLTNLMKFIKEFSQKDRQIILEITEKYKLTSDMNKFSDLRINNGTHGYSKINKEGFLNLRKSYNDNKAIHKLFLLSNYSFNRMIRFNNKNEFNVPVGKGDWSLRQVKYLNEFQKMLNSKKTKITNLDFREMSKLVNKNQFIYIDPPYLNGCAQYNSIWSEKEELDLYKIIEDFDKKNIKFAFSNTVFSNDKENVFLTKWIKKTNFKVIKIKKLYSKTSYNKKNRYDAVEVLITNLQ